MEILYKKSQYTIYYCFVILYAIFTSSIILLSSGFFGVKMFTNRTNSMSPTITTGSLIFVKPSTTYAVGDIISFYAGNEKKSDIRTHRIYQEGGNVYRTKGDANIAFDEKLVAPRNIIGKVIYIIPVFGYFFQFIKSTLGVALFILLPAIFIITKEIMRILSLPIQ